MAMLQEDQRRMSSRLDCTIQTETTERQTRPALRTSIFLNRQQKERGYASPTRPARFPFNRPSPEIAVPDPGELRGFHLGNKVELAGTVGKVVAFPGQAVMCKELTTNFQPGAIG